MSAITRKINEFFRKAVKKDVDKIKSEIILSERQQQIFEMFYIKKQSIDFIADTLCVCRMVVNNELKIIRNQAIVDRNFYYDKTEDPIEYTMINDNELPF